MDSGRDDPVRFRETSTRPPELPDGVVTFLLTDIEGSTPLWETHTAAMSMALARHEGLVTEVVASHGGRLIKSRGEGDSTLSVFVRATDAVAAAWRSSRYWLESSGRRASRFPPEPLCTAGRQSCATVTTTARR